MNIAVLCGSYLPKPSAVAICACNLVKELENQGHRVYVVIPFDNETPQSNVYKFETDNLMSYYSGKKSTRLFVRIKRYLKAIFAKVNIKIDYIDGFCQELQSIGKKVKLDIVIPFCFPFESVLGALKYKEFFDKRVVVKPVIFDNFVENPSLHRIKLNLILKKKRHIELLRQAIIHSERAYICHSQRSFIERYLNDVSSKISFIEHPLLIRPDTVLHTSETIAYTGSFLKGYVPSFQFACILSKLVHLVSNKIELCVMGNDIKPIANLADKYPDQIINYGKVPFGQAQSIINRAGVLLSVSEVSGIQMSSKIFTYMSMGKPIIHLFYKDNDINIKILEKYPYSACFNISNKKDYDTIAIKIKSFVQEYAGHLLPFEEVKSLYPEALPENLVNIILSH